MNWEQAGGRQTLKELKEASNKSMLKMKTLNDPDKQLRINDNLGCI